MFHEWNAHKGDSCISVQIIASLKSMHTSAQTPQLVSTSCYYSGKIPDLKKAYTAREQKLIGKVIRYFIIW